MGYTLSFDASAKCGKADVRGLLHHIARDIDRENGQEVRHSNQDINAARTGDNETLVPDGSGGFQRCEKIEDIESALYDRLSHVKKSLRKDAVVLRPLILQLDPEWYDSHQDEKLHSQAANDMLDWAIESFGGENIIYAVIHQDESNPHLHIGFCPVTADGRLSQKDWFRSPAALRQMHDNFREHMATRGYDIQMDRKKPGKHAKRMSVEEYKDFAELQKAQKAIEAREKALKAQERALRNQATNISKMLQEAQETLQEAQETLSECKEYKKNIADQQQARKLAARQKKIAERVADADALLSAVFDGSSPNISLR